MEITAETTHVCCIDYYYEPLQKAKRIQLVFIFFPQVAFYILFVK